MNILLFGSLRVWIRFGIPEFSEGKANVNDLSSIFIGGNKSDAFICEATKRTTASGDCGIATTVAGLPNAEIWLLPLQVKLTGITRNIEYTDVV
jgi:hypothetical protein